MNSTAIRTWRDVLVGSRAYWCTVLFERLESREGDEPHIRVRYCHDCGGQDEKTGEFEIKAGTEGLVHGDDEALDGARSEF